MKFPKVAILLLLAVPTAASAALVCSEVEEKPLPGGPTVALTSDFGSTKYRPGKPADGTMYDAGESSWTLTRGHSYPIVLDKGGKNLHWRGGRVIGKLPENMAWGPLYRWIDNGAGIMFGGNYKSRVSTPNFTLEGIRIDNSWDGIRPGKNANNFTIRGVYISHNRDDCVENDNLSAGTIEDSLFDGCYTFLSTRAGGSGSTAVGKVVKLDRVLVRMQAFLGDDDQSTKPSHGPIFKWHKGFNGQKDAQTMPLEIRDSVFMADHPGKSNPLNMSVPDALLAGCSGNVMVWLGPGDFPGKLPSCFRVTKDRSVWDKARQDWLLRHPWMK